jgi:hypothetical protein
MRQYRHISNKSWFFLAASVVILATAWDTTFAETETEAFPNTQPSLALADAEFSEAWVDDASDSCASCNSSPCACEPSLGIFPNDWPPGVLQRLFHERHPDGSCWSYSTDAVLFWRNAPPSRPLANLFNGVDTIPGLDANQLESAAAAGPRFRVLHTDACGNGAEFIYLRAANFRSQKLLESPGLASQFEPADLFGNTNQSFTEADVNLGSQFQTFEANSRTTIGKGSLTFLAGFRWFEFREAFTMNTSSPPLATYDYTSSTMNSLYGGQVGIDALLLTSQRFAINSWIKGGAFYNNAVQHTAYQSNLSPPDSFTNAVSGIPAAGSFVGEVGINGRLSITRAIAFRFGYTGLWLESIALATQQLSDQNALQANAGTVLQGVHLGLEGTW